MKDHNLQQKTGDDSENFQSFGDMNIYQGLNYQDARQIAIDVFEANFPKFFAKASEEIRKRFDEFTNLIFEKLTKVAPELIEGFNEPGLQSSLYRAQKEYVKCGDENLGEILAELLIERVKAPYRNLMQIVLDESLKVVAKLTNQHFDMLTLLLLINNSMSPGVDSFDSFKGYIEIQILPFIDSVSLSNQFYSHFEYAGCGSVKMGIGTSLESELLMSYELVFTGMQPNDIRQFIITIDNRLEKLFVIFERLNLTRFSMSNVGIAIGLTNYSDKVKSVPLPALSLWLDPS